MFYKNISWMILTAICAAALPTSVLATDIAHNNKDVSLRDIDSYIDPSIQGNERKIMRSVLQGLAPKDRENVAYFANDGNVYVNKPFMRQVFIPLQHVSGNLYQFPNGEKVVLPGHTPKPRLKSGVQKLQPHITTDPPTQYANSGPYIRVWSKPPSSTTTAGYSYERANIYLPGGNNIDENPVANTKDTTCAYIGGWGNGTGTSGPVCDVGFEHEGGTNFDRWYGMWSAQEFGTNTGNPHSQGNTGTAVRFYSNQTVSLAFYITSTSSGNQANMVFSGHIMAYNPNSNLGTDLGTQTLTCSTSCSANWNPQGYGMVLKSMTSIAQQNPSGIGTADEPTTCSYVHNVIWSGCMIGTGPNASDNHSWTSADTSANSPDVYLGGGNDQVTTNVGAGAGPDRTDSISIP